MIIKNKATIERTKQLSQTHVSRAFHVRKHFCTLDIPPSQTNDQRRPLQPGRMDLGTPDQV